MIAEDSAAVPVAAEKGHVTFFRQSGWLMIATMVGGGLMFAVHTIAQRMPKAEYGVFFTLLQIVTLMGIPAVGLQSVFAQQAAEALKPDQERELAGHEAGHRLESNGGARALRLSVERRLGIARGV